jgi:hypothetical protein
MLSQNTRSKGTKGFSLFYMFIDEAYQPFLFEDLPICFDVPMQEDLARIVLDTKRPPRLFLTLLQQSLFSHFHLGLSQFPATTSPFLSIAAFISLCDRAAIIGLVKGRLLIYPKRFFVSVAVEEGKTVV